MKLTIRDVEKMLNKDVFIIDAFVQGKFVIITINNGMRIKIKNF